VTFNPLPSSLEFIKAGKLRALAVTSTTRQAVLPDTPTVAQFLPGYEATAWFGVGVPKATPSTIVDKLNSDINAGLVDTTLKARLIDLGGEPVAESPDQFAKFITAETGKWSKVVSFAGIRPE